MADDPHHFEFDLDRGIRAQVVKKLEASPLLELTPNVGPKKSGIYALYYRRKLVYIGKAVSEVTKSKRDLRGRLNEHVGKLSQRQIDFADIRCRFLTFASAWWVFAAEFALMVHYEPEWNASGFGSKVPGKGRPGTERVSRFDALFPVVPGRSRRRALIEVDLDAPGPVPAVAEPPAVPYQPKRPLIGPPETRTKKP